MSETRVDFAKDPRFLALFESFPMAVVVMDGEGRLRAANSASRELLGSGEDASVLAGSFGCAVRCVGAVSEAEGCGHSELCASCVVFQSAREAANGETVRRREARVRVRRGERVTEKVVLASAAPFKAVGFGTDIRALVFLEDISDLHRIRGLISICAACKRIQRDDQAWEDLERFVESRSQALFSHGLCPDCARALHPSPSGNGI